MSTLVTGHEYIVSSARKTHRWASMRRRNAWMTGEENGILGGGRRSLVVLLPWAGLRVERRGEIADGREGPRVFARSLWAGGFLWQSFRWHLAERRSSTPALRLFSISVLFTPTLFPFQPSRHGHSRIRIGLLVWACSNTHYWAVDKSNWSVYTAEVISHNGSNLL
jgi:hypothetical protein